MVTKKEPITKTVAKPATKKVVAKPVKVVAKPKTAAKKPLAVKKEAVKPKAKPTPKPVPKKVVEKATVSKPSITVRDVVTPTKPLGVMERMFRYIANIMS